MVEGPEGTVGNDPRWWAEWFEADYSWEGLAKRKIRGGGAYGEQTLQDYWRRDPATGQQRNDAALKEAGELVEFGGRWWHIIHLPLCDETGEVSSLKAGLVHPFRTQLTALVVERLAAAQEAAGIFAGADWISEGHDGRAQFDGGILGHAMRFPDFDTGPLHLSCLRAWIGTVWAMGRVFGPGACFAEAMFFDVARFNNATFAGGASFNGTTFSDSVLASFSDATFSVLTSFDGAIFSGKTLFKNTRFSEGAGFASATFSGSTDFAKANFASDADFSSATFSETINFDSANFSGIADFASAIFSGRTTFSGATFSGRASFTCAAFSGRTSYDSVTFCDLALFQSAVFSSAVRFNSAIFEKRVLFSSGEETGFGVGARSSFRRAVFKGPVEFSATIAEPNESFAGAFYAARFLDTADFSDAVAPGEAGRLAIAFEEAQFEKALILTDGPDHQARGYFRNAMLSAAKSKNVGARDIHLRQLEAGCRTVKIAMGKARDELREQRYYRFRLRARLGRSDIDRWERVFGLVYRLLSDFGSSLWRPLFGLAVLIVIAGLIYFAWAAWLGVARPGDAWEGQGMALAAVFKPFSTLGDAVTGKTAHPSFVAALMAVNPAVAMGVRLATTIQSLLSGVLIFLFALAVKRRFQIS